MRGFINSVHYVRTFALCLVLLVTCSLPVLAESHSSPVVSDDQVDSIFDVANEEYKDGNYENAITLYEGLLSGSGTNATDIHYNMGNAFFRLKEYGKAIAAYRRALRLTPRDQDAIANLRLARDASLDKIDQPRSAELWRDVLFFHYELSSAETETIFFAAYVAAAAFGIGLLFWKSRQLKWLALATLLVAVTFGASYAFKWREVTHPSEAVVVAKEAQVHTGPGDKYIVSFSLHDGAELRVRKLENNWRQIELTDGRRGWIEETNIETI